MPKFACKKVERKIKITKTEAMDDNLFVEGSFNQKCFQFEKLNTLKNIALVFPKVIQRILLLLPPTAHKTLRLTNKSLKYAVEQYVGINLLLSENHTDFDISDKVQIINRELLYSLRTIGICRLRGVHLLKNKFSDIITHPYLLQSISLFGQVDHHILIGVLKECWNLRSIRLLETNQYQVLVRGDFIDFMRLMSDLLENRKGIPLKNLKYLKIQCSTTSTMGFVLVMLSVLEVKNLETFHCCIGPVHANFHSLITGIVMNIINSAFHSLKDLCIVVETSDAYPEITTKRRFLRKLTLFNEECPGKLITFAETFTKMYLKGVQRGDWLKKLLFETGRKTKNLSRIRLDIDTPDDFSNYWIHFLAHQRSLTLLEISAFCNWSLVENIVKQNADTLETLALVMEFHSPMDVTLFFHRHRCCGLRRLVLKNFDFNWISREQLEMLRTGHLINAKFDELFPNLESLALCNLLVKSTDLRRVTNIVKLKDFILSILEMDGENGDFTDPDNMFGLLDKDFQALLYQRYLDHIIVSKEAIVSCGSQAERIKASDELTMLINNPMFHETSSLGWKLLTIDDEHVAVVHGRNVTGRDWIFPLILSVLEDTLEVDAISTQNLISDDMT